MTAILVPVLAAGGALLRWQLGRLNRVVPLGTLLVNVVAAGIAGLLIGSSETVLTVLGVGVLGSVSTFSTVIGEISDSDVAPRTRLFYLVATIVLGIAAAAVGIELSDA